jgi:adenine-specific DNA-methyltransferase
MKYMGSKRMMLQNGLGELITECSHSAGRIVDLFCGASSVSWYAAEKTRRQVLAVDLQAYAVALASAVIGRNVPLDATALDSKWLTPAERNRKRSSLWRQASCLENRSLKKLVADSRNLCAKDSSIGPVWNAYGGYYFSPAQALSIDYMLQHLPQTEPERAVCIAALISAASKCAASPGHTAQPFRPTRKAGVFLRGAWRRDLVTVARTALEQICPRHANTVGKAEESNALEIARHLTPKDLVIVDPPYSGVQYSRFYHVLETIARGHCGPVEGAGRYPEISKRPQSAFCNKSQSRDALEKLLGNLAESGSTVILTFPAGECSNGLSGRSVTKIAQENFEIRKKVVKTRFSTLGGNNSLRKSRHPRNELLLLLQPKMG